MAIRAAALLASLPLLACWGMDEEPALPQRGEPAAPAYAGTRACAGCHPREALAWQGSHHDLAMQAATPEAVLGDFGGAELLHLGVRSRFLRRGAAFLVETEGPDGAPAEFEIAYTFGVEPLQQYLVRFPDGRLQALGIAWDSRPASEGGGRWYSLYPDERFAPGDPLHWTGLAQNWNHMCAHCHSTGVRKRYDAKSDRFDTAFAEVDVGCEACHGPGSRHAAWARRPEGPDPGLPVAFGPRPAWTFADGQAIARREPPPVAAPGSAGSVEADTCAPCHSRRGLLREADAAGRPLGESHRLALLEEGLYYADGQMQDEVYVHGSFLQSRMRAAGVGCGDCHDPHSLSLRGGDGPDAVCSHCHLRERFASPGHHGHPAGSEGASCVACHMPARVYMGIDSRRDHGFRVPRPDLSAATGAPSACEACHAERTPGWAAAAIRGWGGADRRARPHFGEALAAARRHLPGARAALRALAADSAQPGIARATALEELAALGPAALDPVLEAALGDADPLVRRAAAAGSAGIEPRRRRRLLGPLLSDPDLGVRLEALRATRDLPGPLWPPKERQARARLRAEFRQVQALHADRPESWSELAELDRALGRPDRAQSHLERALAIWPDFAPAAVNLADLLREQGRDAEGERVLRAALPSAPASAALHEALGLLLVREGRGEEALESLRRAHALAPDVPHHAFVLALALDAAGRGSEATALLEASHRRFPGDAELLLALATRARDRGARQEALAWARRLVEVAPEEPISGRLLDSLRREPPPGGG